MQVAGLTTGRVQERLAGDGEVTRVERLTIEDDGAVLTASGTFGPAERLNLQVQGEAIRWNGCSNSPGHRCGWRAGRIWREHWLARLLRRRRWAFDVRTGAIAINGQRLDAAQGWIDADGELAATDLTLAHDAAAFR